MRSAPAHWVIVSTVLAAALVWIIATVGPLETTDRTVTRLTLPSGVGAVAPDFALPDTDGADWSLENHLGEKPVLLEFIDVDCAHCVAEIPDLLDLHDEYGENVTFVSVETNLIGCSASCCCVAEFKAQHATPWTYLVETNGHRVSDAYSVVGVPTFVLIREDGIIAYRQVGGGDPAGLRAALNAVLS